ncbi:MAG: BamA/TamA family outer membrane protein [Gemmatimonadaceae bacterium]
MNGTALRAAAIALFAMAAAAAAPRAASAQGTSCDQGELEVRDLEFRGNDALSDGELEVSIATTRTAFLRRTLRIAVGTKRCLDRESLPRDVLSLISLYRERGFYETRVDTLVQELGSRAVRVVFTIREGPPTILRSYSVSGLDGVADSAALVNARRLRVGDRFDSSLLFADMDTIRQRLRNTGFHRADLLSPGYVRNNDSLIVDVTLTVLPGARARFGEPVFDVTAMDGRGQQISDQVARRVLGIVPGSRYSDRAVINAQRALFQLGTYRHVEVVPADSQPAGDTIVVLAVRLTEGYMRQVDSEFGWATLDCGRVRANYTDRNWLGTARRLDLSGQASKIGYGEPLATESTRRLCDFNGQSPLAEDKRFSERLHYHAGAAIAQPRLLGTLWVPTLSLYSERRGEYRAYLRTTFVGADFSAVRDVAERTQLRMGYGVEYGETDADAAALCALFNRCTPAEQGRLTSLATLGVASARITRIRTDNPLAPSRGTVLRGELRSSASRLLGTSPDQFFNKATGDGALYLPFGWRNVLALRLRLGYVHGLGDASGAVGFVPTQERMYAGGATSVRGFQQNELGSLVYIASGTVAGSIDTITVGVVGGETIYNMHAIVNPDTLRIDRTVPLGGNALFVANVDYRVRDPFFLPDLLQYSFFVDVGEVWTPSAQDPALRFNRLKMTPGVGLRLFTPIGPVVVNAGYNDYRRAAGPLYYNPSVERLHCVAPGNTIPLRTNASGQLEQVESSDPCPGAFQPPRPTRFTQRLTFTFSIGSEF